MLLFLCYVKYNFYNDKKTKKFQFLLKAPDRGKISILYRVVFRIIFRRAAGTRYSSTSAGHGY